jgi:hypothetical protein
MYISLQAQQYQSMMEEVFQNRNLHFGFCFSISINCSCLCQASGRLACTTTELSIARVATGDTSAFKSTIEP